MSFGDKANDNYKEKSIKLQEYQDLNKCSDSYVTVPIKLTDDLARASTEIIHSMFMAIIILVLDGLYMCILLLVLCRNGCTFVDPKMRTV